MSAWDHEGIDDRLRALVATKGLSFANVAAQLNREYGTALTRNACIGKSKRNGFPVSPEKRTFRGQRAITKKQRPRADNIVKHMSEFTPIINDDIPIEQRKTLLELTLWTCRWPCGEGASMFFCGAMPVDGRPYCGAHCARAYTVTTYTRKPYIQPRGRAA